MSKEILLQILNQRLYFYLFLIIFAHGIFWFTMINFGVYTLTKKIISNKIVPFIVLGTFCTLLGHTVLPNILFGFMVLAIFCFAIKILAKATMVEAVIISIMTYLIIGVSVLIIQEPLFALYPYLIDFILKTPLGIAVGSLFEIILPLILLFTIHALQLQPKLFFRKKITFLDIAGIFLMLDLFYFFYDTSFIIIKNYANHQHFSLSIIIQWACSVVGILAFYVFMMCTRKKYQKEDTEKEELKKQLQELITENNHYIIEAVKNINQPEPVAAIAAPSLDLTDNEIRVLKLLIDGKNNKEISFSLDMSIGTIRNIISKLLERFGLQDRTQLAIYTLKNIKL